MAHYAILDENNVVIFVHPGKNENEDGIDWEEYYGAKRTSYNTYGGTHKNGGTPFRYNYAGIGMIFDPNFGEDGAFYEPQPFPSWQLNENTALWEPPIPAPNDGQIYYWDENQQAWINVI